MYAAIARLCKPSRVALNSYVLVLLAFVACLIFPRGADAALPPPPPDGGYAGNNTAEGTSALFSLTTGVNNTAVGFQALFHNTTGSFNSAEGFRALFFNTAGSKNTATGATALFANTTGSFNQADGVNALFNNSTGANNSANGSQALFHNTTGNFGTATGAVALFNNTTGTFNAAHGCQALFSNTTGNQNTAEGFQALYQNTTGANNVAVGSVAFSNLDTGNNNVGVGRGAGSGLQMGNGNTFIGSDAGANEGPNVDNVICIGTAGDTQAAGQVTPNRCFIGHIVGVTTGGPAPSVPVVIDQDGQLGTVASSRRFKQDIKLMDQASEAILKLKPVTFHYKNRDVKNDLTPQFGLIAEDVEQVDRDLVAYGKDGKLWTVRYDAVNAMLLNEFLKEHQKVEEQAASITALKSTVAQQQKGMEILTAQLKEQAAQIQKVSAQIQLSKPAPRTAKNGN